MSSNPPSKPLSISLSSSKTTKKPSSSSSTSKLNRGGTESLPHRSHALLNSTSKRRTNHFHDNSDDDDDDDDGLRVPTHEEVTGFDREAGGAISTADRDREKNKKRELVIKVESNNNWRDRGRRRRGKNLLPAEVQRQREAEAGAGGNGEGKVVVEREGPGVEFGLSYAKKGEEGGEGDVAMVDTEPQPEPEVRKELTEDEIALQSLVRGANGEEGRRSDLVIGGSALDGDDDHQDEATSFREDVASRPDMASLDQYAAVPVEEFGAALLRGMGWKEGQPVGRGNYAAGGNANGAKARVPERRPGYLGIGAKDIGGKMGAEAEIGAWGKTAMRKSKRDGGSSGEGLYMPVMMKQKNTGELITEDEFKTLSKSGQVMEEDWKERRDRNLEKNGRDRRRYYDDDDNDYDRNKRGSSRRDRSRSSDRKESDSRRRRDDSEDNSRGRGGDDRYYRDREGYRDRDRDRDSDRKHKDSRRRRDDYDSRASSSSHSSRRDRGDRRDRDRDSDRESYRKRDRYGDDDRKRSSRREEVH